MGKPDDGCHLTEKLLSLKTCTLGVQADIHPPSVYAS